jgi:glutaredoxin
VSQKRRIEVFTAGCALCSETLNLVKNSVSECGCEVIEVRCEGDEQCEAAKQYGITKMPTVVVDGRIAFEGRITPAQAELLRR